MFFSHLKGRVDFIGQIAKSGNKNDSKYKKRIDRYLKLKETLQKIQDKEALEVNYMQSGKDTIKSYWQSNEHRDLIKNQLILIEHLLTC